MTYEEQVKLRAYTYEAERRLKVRDLAKAAAESDDAYHGGYHFPVMGRRRWFSHYRENDTLPAAGSTRYHTITVSLAPFLQGTAAAQLIAERIIEDQWRDDR